MRVLLASLLVVLSACDLARGDVIVSNETAEPVRFAVAYGDGAFGRLPAPEDVSAMRPLAPGADVRLGRAVALADSGGVTVAFYSVPVSPEARSQRVRTEAAGANYLRDAFGDIVLRID